MDQIQKDKKNQKAKKIGQVNEINGYQIVEELGSGSYSTVFKVRKGDQIWALKLLDKEQIKRENLYECVQTEIKVMKKLDTPHCIKIFDQFVYKNWVCLLLEYCNEGTLMQYVVSKKPNEDQCMQIFIQILKGFQEIHKNSYLHRDLKPENIFIHNGVFKIADFGLAKSSSVGRTQCGSSYYMSPEIQLRQSHDHKSDIWSLGVVLYFMMFRSFPFKSKGNRLNEIYKACTPEFDLRKHLGNNQYNFKFSQDLVDFFKLIFAYDPNQRISFSYLFSCNKLIQKYLNGSKINEATNFYKGLEQKNIKESVPQQLVEQDKYQQKRKSQNFNIINPANSIINEENEPDICIEQHQNSEDILPNKILIENKNSWNYLHNQKIQNNEENLKEIDEEAKAYKLNNFRNIIENIDQNNESDIKTEVKKMLENIIGPKLQRKCTPDSNSQLSEITSSCRKGLKKLAEIDIKNQTLKQQYQQIYTTYLFRIQKYNFIGDVLNLLPNLNLPQNTDLVSHYVLCKLLLFYALKLRNSLMHQQNIFKLEGFSSFVESKYKEKLIDKINFDILRWNSKFVMFYYSIDTETMIKSEKLKSLITMEVKETDYNKQLKQPSRIILDAIFKQSYKEGITQYRQLKKQQEQINEKINNIQQENNQQVKNIQNYKKIQEELEKQIQSLQNIRLSFCILLTMVINNIFEFQSTKITFQVYYQNEGTQNIKNKGFDFWKFYMWIQKAPQDLIIESIHQVVQAAYGVEKLKSIQHMCENNDINNNHNHSDNNYQSNINNQLSNKNGNFE